MDHRGLLLSLLVWFVSMASTIAAATVTAETFNCTEGRHRSLRRWFIWSARLWWFVWSSKLCYEQTLLEEADQFTSSMDAGSVVKAQTWRLFVLQKGHQIRSNCISVQLGRRELREHMLVEWYLVVKTHYNTGCHKCVPIIRVGGTL